MRHSLNQIERMRNFYLGLSLFLTAILPAKSYGQTCSGNIELGVDQVINGGFELTDPDPTSPYYNTPYYGFGWDSTEYCVFQSGQTASNGGPFTCNTGDGFSSPHTVYIGDDADYMNPGAFTGTAAAGNNFYMIDGATNLPNTFWRQQVYVEPNQWYYFEISALTMFTSDPSDLANFGFYLDGTSFSPNLTVPATAGTWDTYIDSVYYTGPAGYVTLEIRNELGGNFGNGNDWAIDELHFTPGCRFGSPGPQPELDESITLCGTTGSISLQDFGLDCSDPTLDFTWSTGETTCAITINSAIDPVTLCVSQNGSCVRSAVTAVINDFSVDIGPDVDLCNPVTHTFTASLSDNHSGNFVTYQWYLDGVAIPGETGPTYTATGPGTYRVDVDDASCGIRSDEAVVTMSAPEPIDAYFCAPPAQNVTLGIEDLGGEYDWYDVSTGGTILAGGTNTNTFITPAISASTTYYVEDSRDLVSTTGPTNQTQATAECRNADCRGTSFTVYWPMDLNSVQILNATNWEGCNNTTNYSRTIRLLDADNGNALVQSANITIDCQNTTTAQTLNLGFTDIQPGNYILDDGDGASVFNHSTTTNWPIEVPDIIRIDEGLGSTTGIFFNWDIDYTLPCERTPVNAILQCCPNQPTSLNIAPAGPIDICAGSNQLLTATAAGPTSYEYIWYFNGIGAGNVVQAQSTTNTYLATQAGTYFVRALDPSDPTCYLDASVTINEIDYSVDLGGPYTLCSPGNVTLDAGAPTPGPITYQWYRDGAAIGGATGQTQFVNQTGTYSVDMTTPCGVYTDDAVVTIDASGLTPGNDTICPVPGVANLSISGGSGTYNWYAASTGGAPINTGATYNPAITGTTTYWVEDAASIAGSLSPGMGGFTNHWDATSTPQRFDAFTSFTLNSVDVQAQVWQGGCGNTSSTRSITIELWQGGVATGQTFTEPAMSCAASLQTLNVGFNITAGVGYELRIAGVGGGHVYTSTDAGPTTDPGVVTLNGSGGTNNRSGAFFNWNYSSGSPCDRTPVVAAEYCPAACTPPTTATLPASTFCSGTGDTLRVTTDAPAGYLYTWYDGGTVVAGPTADLDSLIISTTGSYRVRIADPSDPNNASCYLESNVVTPTINSATANAGTDDSFCDGQGNATITATGGGTYSWDNGLGAGASHTVTPAATTTYVVTVTDGNGCTDTDDVTITVDPLPTADAGTDDSFCDGQGNATITATGGGTYSWDNGLGAGASHTVTPAATTTYVVTVTDGNGCTDTDDVTITVDPLPTADAGTDDSFCDGQGNATITATGGGTYSWDNGLGAGASHTVTPAATTTYVVTVTDGNGCTDTDDVIITVDPLPTADAGTDDSFCDGQGNATITATGGGTYSWDNGLGAGASHTVTPAATTTYVVTVTDGNGCTDTDDVIITVDPLPTADAGTDDSFCDGQGNATITATGGGTYTWDNGLGAGASHTVTPAATTTYVVTVTDGNGCTDTDDVTITVDPLPTADAGTDDSFCDGQGNATITATGGGTYTWDNGLGAGASHTVTPAATTTYVVTVTDGNGCTDTDDVTITVDPLPTADAGTDDSFCDGQGNATITATGGGTYSWDNGLGAGASHTVTPAATTTYVVTVTDGNGCTDTDDVIITVDPLPTADAGTDDSFCDGQGNATITATGGGTYSWDNGLGAGASHTVTPAATTTYVVTVTDGNGCTDTDDVIITVDPLPTADAGTDDSFCDGQGNAIITATGGGTYSWDNGLGAGASHTVTPAATTTYVVTVTDGNGCTDTDDVIITVDPLPTADAGTDDSFCDGQGNATITATGGGTYSWDNGLGAGASHTVTPAATTTYVVTVTDGNHYCMMYRYR